MPASSPLLIREMALSEFARTWGSIRAFRSFFFESLRSTGCPFDNSFNKSADGDEATPRVPAAGSESEPDPHPSAATTRLKARMRDSTLEIIGVCEPAS